jgi:membrane-associated phospholipid phosphatase
VPVPLPGRPAPPSLPPAPSLLEPSSNAVPPPPPFAVYELSWGVDGSLLAVAAALGASAIIVSRRDPCSSPSCGRYMLGGPMDRWAVGPKSSGWSDLSDLTKRLTLATPIALELVSLATPSKERAAGLVADAVVISEVMLITGALTALLKDGVGRRRPWSYDVDATDRPFERDTMRSFPSGHSSETFAAATVGCVTFVRRHQPGAAGAVAACGPGYALAAVTAGLRVSAAAHFPTDVLLGSLIGTGVGLAVPLLHDDPRRRHHLMLTPSPGGLGVGLGGAF